MRYFTKIYLFYFCIILCDCKVEEPQNSPQITTTYATDISIDKATLNGEIINEGSTAIKENGFVYSNSNLTPTLTDLKIVSIKAKGPFSSTLTNLTLGTKYYYRSYATNNQGTTMGNVVSFSTLDVKSPTVLTVTPQNISSNSVTLIGNVTEDGGSNITQLGFYLYEYNNLTIKSSVLIQATEIGLGEFKKSIISLIPNTKYSVRAFAKNTKETSLGNEIFFNTLTDPSLSTVVSKTGRIWLDKNLGASSVAINVTDSKAFGYLFQWGRNSDGHQLRDSKLSLNLATSKSNAGNLFILSNNSIGDWLVDQDDKLWSGSSPLGGVNNVCPTGFRLPTIDEWKAEIESWNSIGAFNSPLKLTAAGTRGNVKGDINDEGNIGYYWSSTPSPVGKTAYGIGFNINDQNPNIGFTYRAKGASVRCIKE